MKATKETAGTYAMGDWVVIGENNTKAPVGAVGRIAATLESGVLIVEVGHMGDRYVLRAPNLTPHAGPPPGREMVPLATAPAPTPDVAAAVQDLVLAEVAMPEPAPAATPRKTTRASQPWSEAAKQKHRETLARKRAERSRAPPSETPSEAAWTIEEITEPPVDVAPPAASEPPVSDPEPAQPIAMLREPLAAPPRAVAHVTDALRWAIGAGAEQGLSVARLRLLVDTLGEIEQEVAGV